MPKPKSSPVPCSVPAGSEGARRVPGSTFADAWSLELPRAPESPLAMYLKVASKAPAWIEAAMRARNRAVAPLGLKDLGSFRPAYPSKRAVDYRAGERVGIFTIESSTDREVVFVDHDRHLSAWVCLAKRDGGDSSVLTLSTIVRVKSWLGHAYLIPVLPAHKVIAPAMLALARGG